jgi:chromosome partitioning protein
MTQAHVIVLGNEKGGTGKSTTAVHIAVALAHTGLRVGAIDLDARQRTFARYIENRTAFAAKHGLDLPTPETVVIADEDASADRERLIAQVAAFARTKDAVVIDTPGRDSVLARTALAVSDTLITPLNDSFVDFDLIGQVDAESFKVKRPSFYAELVWEARKARAKIDGGSVDWVVLRNRMSTLEARNMRRVGGALDELSKRVGFRVIPGVSERVIYRELFPKGLTLLDTTAIGEVNMSHVAARAELRELIGGLALPAWEGAPQAAVA